MFLLNVGRGFFFSLGLMNNFNCWFLFSFVLSFRFFMYSVMGKFEEVDFDEFGDFFFIVIYIKYIIYIFRKI